MNPGYVYLENIGRMLPENLKKALRFYFITDDSVSAFSPVEQVKIAMHAGATMIQYRNKYFSGRYFKEVQTIRDLCGSNGIPFIINDNILLAKAVGADGVHLGQSDEEPAIARSILGAEAVVGISVSSLNELKNTTLQSCDYIGAGPVFPTATKADAGEVMGLCGLESVVKASLLPVVAIGGIDETNATSCFTAGASGISAITFISRAVNPLQNGMKLGAACSCRHRPSIESPWHDEFALIEKLVDQVSAQPIADSYIQVPPGDDAGLLHMIKHPVVTTDTQKEGVHFRLDWQTPEEIGYKAVIITLSDLAASYATPVCLFVNLSLPSYVSDKMVESIYKGMNRALLKYACPMGGGNISEGFELSLDLFAIGEGRDDIFPTRSRALPGDGLYCTGPLGLARAGLDALIRKEVTFKNLIEKFKLPPIRCEAAKVLAENNVKCVMDISDGLAGDARHIAEASQITIEFILPPPMLDPDLVAYCEKYHLVASEMAFAGGEDYELLFACKPDLFKAIQKELPGSFQVGRCLSFAGTRVLNLPSNILSFQHGGKRNR